MEAKENSSARKIISNTTFKSFLILGDTFSHSISMTCHPCRPDIVLSHLISPFILGEISPCFGKILPLNNTVVIPVVTLSPVKVEIDAWATLVAQPIWKMPKFKWQNCFPSWYTVLMFKVEKITFFQKSCSSLRSLPGKYLVWDMLTFCCMNANIFTVSCGLITSSVMDISSTCMKVCHFVYWK